MKTRLTKRALLFTLLCFAAALSACAVPAPTTTDEAPRALYQEQHRPQFHFSPPEMWMNDPNGLVYRLGEYHLFYQYYPADKVWGPMHWGHAVSRDLVHWENLPIALYPDEHGYIFSGSAVVDWNNSSGFGQQGDPPLVAIFTYHDPERGKLETNDHETQGIAYSNDRGRTWTKYAGNPVLPNLGRQRDFRDPNVFWHEATQRWVMALSVGDHVQFWGSPDLKAWTHLSDFGRDRGAHDGVWECPDLFPLQVEGRDESLWVLIQNLNPGGPQGGSGTQYFIGDFDGETFTLDSGFAAQLEAEGPAWLDWGRDNYAGVTWSDLPAADHRRVFIGWMSNWDYAQQVPTHPWRSAMTLPRSLHLVETDRGLRVFSRPVAELESLRREVFELAAGTVEGRVPYVIKRSDVPSPPGGDAPAGIRPATGGVASGTVIPSPAKTGDATGPWSSAEMLLEFLLPEGPVDFGIELSNGQGERYRLGFNSMHDEFYSDRRQAGDHAFSAKFADRIHGAPRTDAFKIVRMHLFLDASSVEMFADDGATVLTDTFFPSEPFDRFALYSNAWPVRFLGGKIYRLKSIWQD